MSASTSACEQWALPSKECTETHERRPAALVVMRKVVRVVHLLQSFERMLDIWIFYVKPRYNNVCPTVMTIG